MDPSMTRFNITMNQALNLVFRALENGVGGQVFIPKLKAYKVGDMKDAILDLLDSKNETETISIRPGEKSHEILINRDELRKTFETKEDYVIYEKQIQNQEVIKSQGLVETNRTDEYSSDKVISLTKNEIKDILKQENLLP